MPVTITAWFGGDPIEVLPLGDTEKVVYSITKHDGEATAGDVMLWHDCDRSVWLANPDADPDVARKSSGFTPANVSAHTLVSLDPLHLEPSVYWPACCGMHGFIRDGRWIAA